MKLLYLTFLFFLSLMSNAQVNLPLNDKGEVEYSEVVNVDSVSADELYNRAKLFIADMFVSARSVIQHDDAANKQILDKGNISADYSWNPLSNCPAHVDFTFTIFFKDNKYKYSLKPQNHVFEPACKLTGGGGNLAGEKPECGTFNMPKLFWNDIKLKADSDFKKFIESLKVGMKTKVDNDW